MCVFDNRLKASILLKLSIVWTSFDLDPKVGLGSSPTSPNNKFVEREKKKLA